MSLHSQKHNTFLSPRDGPRSYWQTDKDELREAFQVMRGWLQERMRILSWIISMNKQTKALPILCNVEM